MGCATSSPEEPPQQAAQKYVAAPETVVKEEAKSFTSEKAEKASQQLSKVPSIKSLPSIKKEAAPEQTQEPEPEPEREPEPETQEQAPLVTGADAPVSKVNDMLAAQETLMKISSLVQKFAAARSERTTPVQVLRRVLDLVVTDCHATFACIQVVAEAHDLAMIVAMVGSPESFLEQNRLQLLNGYGYAADSILKTLQYMDWRPSAGPADALLQDWRTLVQSLDLIQLSAVPICIADKCLGILTIGVDASSEHDGGNVMWPSYMQLVASSLSGMIKDTAIPKYLDLIRDVHASEELDALVHKVIGHFRHILGHNNKPHVWYRLALTGNGNSTTTIFDDLTQVPTPSSRSTNTSAGQASATNLIKNVQANGGVIRTVMSMKSTIMKISIHNRQQVMIPDVQKLINQSGNVSSDLFNTRLIKPPTSVLVFPFKVRSNIFGVIYCMSGVSTDFSDVSPRLRELCEVMAPHFMQALTGRHLSAQYQEVQAAVPEIASGSQSGRESVSRGLSGHKMSDMYNVGMSISASMSGDYQAISMSRSSTGALVTGLTEKLNQKRIKSAMDFSANKQLADLQIHNLLGEGGFAKVFRGLWQGLVVGIKIVVDDGKNEKMVMKNAHEIAILSTLSHPHVTQAYLCLTDVVVRELITSCMRAPSPQVLNSPAYKYLVAMEEKMCHVEVIEYCDLGNLLTAVQKQVFYSGPVEKTLSLLADHAHDGQPGFDELQENAPGATINLRALLLTLIEIASALGYLHRMGVVHCDIKPANVLLKKSSNDPRGFTCKVSDFGLSRVQDDDNSSTFPFNSCGTVAYVAPEALVCNKKVNSSVDVYAYGILMWEMYTGQKPYGSMSQQALVEEVVTRGLRPKFPGSSPPAYMQLAQACWSGQPHMRPSFEEALVVMNGMLQAIDDKSIDSQYLVETSGSSGSVEYLPGFKPDPSVLAAGLGERGLRQGGGKVRSPGGGARSNLSAMKS